jgi:NADPH-dependent curcumin reductase CurA
MIGGTVGEVVESRHAGYKAGDKVVGMGGWQQYSIVVGAQPGMLRKVVPGVTAWVGLNTIIEAKEGETIVVSAASGAVGGVVGQLARARGCRAVGIAGGPDKCGYVVKELGFDACIDYKTLDGTDAIAQALAQACPKGIDGHFENVGGAILDAVMRNANAFSRIAMCGMIAGYNGVPIPMAAPQLILTNRMKVQGFIVSEHMPLWPQALAELGERVGNGTLKYRETVAQGLQSAPEAFIGLLKGRNFGKQLVKLV